MGIDGIGKGTGPGAIVPEIASTVGNAAKAGTGAEPFRVEKGVSVQASGPLTIERVRSGDLTVSEYLDGKVNEVTSHLVGRLAPDQLAFVRQNLREQLSTDPVLVDLVKAATGALPPRNE
jgi:hypothetical protein